MDAAGQAFGGLFALGGHHHVGALTGQPQARALPIPRLAPVTSADAAVADRDEGRKSGLAYV